MSGQDSHLFLRELRQQATEAEQRLCSIVRRNAVGAHFRRQYPIGPYVVDFCCHAARLVIELDGQAHEGSCAAQADQLRTNALRARGFRVMRFENRQVMESPDAVVAVIRQALALTPTEIALRYGPSALTGTSPLARRG